jgi:N-acetylglucosamine-6-phosphate deacetylase
MEGIHVEGPHISVEDGPRGAHPREHVRPPDYGEFLAWQEAARGSVKMVTVAPEWPGVCAYIEKLAGEGVVVAIGHTQASAAQIHDAVQAGASVSTHLGNGAGSKHRKDPFIQQQLQEGRLTASFIADGHHLPAAFLRDALAAKGLEKSMLVTDAAAPAGCEPGLYELGTVPVELRADGRVTLRGSDRLAGSSLTMDRAIAVVMQQAAVNLAGATVMATSNPARAGRIPNRLRGLKPGERGDLVRFHLADGGIKVSETYLGGQRV